MTESESHGPVDEAFASFLREIDDGRAPDFEEWVRSFPTLEAELRRNYAMWKTLGAATPGREPVSTVRLFHREVDPTLTEVDESSPLANLTPGMELEDFRLVRKIAQGGQGQVWEAHQASLDRTVAMKFLRPDRLTESSLAFFEREGRAGGRLNHPGIVTIHATGESGGVNWIAQELVPGRCNLRDFVDDMRAASSLPAKYYESVATFFIELTDAMQFAHDAGVIHRDLKPQNILVTPDDHPKVTDFGLARLVGEASVSGPRSMGGTPHYMSPEQATGKLVGIDARSDVFSLGVVLYEVLTLARPFDAETPARLYDQILREEPKDPRVLESRVPEDLAIICLKALEKRRSERYASMQEVGDDLQRYLADEPLVAERPGIVRRTRKWMRRHPAGTTAATLGAALLALGLWAGSELRSVGAEAKRQQKENLVIQADYAIENAQLDKARRLMAEYAALAPGDFLPHLVMARGYSQHLRLKEAEEELNVARRMGFESGAPADGGDARAHYIHALALVVDRDPELLGQAVHHLEQAIHLDPLLRSSYFPLYQIHKERGDFEAADDALASFQEVLATGDDYYDLVRAMRSELDGAHEDAIEILLAMETRVGAQRSEELRVDRILGRLYLDRALTEGGVASTSDLDAAERRLRAAIAAARTDAGSWGNLGTLQLRRFMNDQQGPDADEHLARAVEYGQRAIEEYARLTAGHEIVLSALTMQATRAFNEADLAEDLFDEAESAAAELRELDPENAALGMMTAQIAFYRGLAAGASGDTGLMEELYRKSVALNPDQVLPYIWIAQFDYSRGQYAAAFEHLQAARDTCSRFPNDPAVRDLHPAMLAKLHIWTFGVASQIGTAEANEVASAARDELETLFSKSPAVEPVELLNWIEFLATSPSLSLRDCEGAREGLERFGLAAKLAGTPYESALRDVESLVQRCD